MTQKSLVRLDYWIDPVFDALVGQQDDIALTVCHAGMTGAEQDAIREQAHAYHICAARDEVPPDWQVDQAFLEKAPQLLCVSSSGAGYDPVDVQACTAAGVLVVNQSGCNADSVAEHTLGLMLSVRHRITESDRVMRSGQFGSREELMGRELRGLTLGLVGVGNIGRRVAQLAKAFGMHVLGCDPYVDAELLRERAVEPVTLDTLIAQSDVVSLHCPLNAQTRDLFDTRRLEKMKPGAIFISTARGGIHNESALATVLQSGHLSGAGLDVWSPEPPPADNPLLRLDNVVATYHTAGVTHEARHNAARMGAEQLIGVLAGERPARLINPQVWDFFSERYKSVFR